MKLFVSALEYSANVHLCEVLREIVGRGESVELCGIFDEKMVGNLSLGLHSADFANLGRFADLSPVSHPKFAKNHESQTENPSVVDSALNAQNLGENNAQSAKSSLDSAKLQNLNKKVLCEAPENSPASWCKKSGEASSSASADFLLEAEKRGSPPKSEKRQLLGTHFKKVGGSVAGGAALLREEKNSNENAESHNDGFNITGKSLCDTNSIAVMGFIDVLKKAKFFLDLRKKCLNLALTADKILLMDSSSFNIPLAKRIKKRDKTKQIIYYILPQVWAWKPWRAKAIEANCDRLAAILPFEVGFYKEKVKFVGHPLLDEIKAFRVGNSVLGMQFRTCENFGESTDSSLVLSPKFSQIQKPHRNHFDCDSLRKSIANYAKIAESTLDSAESQNLIKKESCEAPENSPASWCKKSGEASSSGKADFLLEADKRGSPPKSEKRQLLGTHFKKVGGSVAGGAALLRKESSENCGDGVAESSLDSVDSAILSQNGLPRKFCESARNDDSFRDSAVDYYADSANQAKIAESSNIFSFMPGSRTSEIKRIFPIFTEVKDALKSRDKDAKFHLIIPQKFASQNLAQIYGDVSDFHISFDAHRSLFQSRFAFICSGTATLECALIGTPFVLGYKCRALEAFVARCFLNVKFIGLANILYEKISPNNTFHTELIQGDLSAQNLLSALDSANENDFLQKSLALRKYLKCGSASAVAKMLYGL